MAKADLNSKEFVVIGDLSEDGQFIKINHHRPLFRLIGHLVGKKLEVGFKLFKYKRSDAQNRWMWGVAYVTICAWWKESFGEKVDKDTLHAYSKQVILGGADNESVVFTKDEFDSLIKELYTLSNSHCVEDVITLVNKLKPQWTVNMRVQEILGKRVLVDTTDVNTSTMNTQQFCDFKDALQAHWAEKGCNIPDPKPDSNNSITDYIDD